MAYIHFVRLFRAIVCILAYCARDFYNSFKNIFIVVNNEDDVDNHNHHHHHPLVDEMLVQYTKAKSWVKDILLMIEGEEKTTTTASPPQPSQPSQPQKADEQLDILVDPREHRFTIFPIVYPKLWDAYERAKSCFWDVAEVDLSRDAAGWKQLTPAEQYFIKQILAFFAASDSIVNLNLLEWFLNKTTVMEANCFYTFQAAMENIHSEMYSKLIQKFSANEAEFKHMINAIETMPFVKTKADWALRWINDKDLPLGQRTVAFAIVEGVFFSGSFAAIFWLKGRGILPGLMYSNELISRDEAQHCAFAALLLNEGFVRRPPRSVIVSMLEDAVETEKKFFQNALAEPMFGMNANLMGQYIEFVADQLMLQLNESTVYDTPNPFRFMDSISMQGKTNFFERRVGEYAKTHAFLNEKESEFFTNDFFF